MKTSHTVLLSVFLSVLACVIIFVCFFDVNIKEERSDDNIEDLSPAAVLGVFGSAIDEYASLLEEYPETEDTDVALKSLGVSCDIIEECLDLVAGEDKMVDAAADMYGLAGDVLSEPDKLEETVTDFLDRLF